MKTSDILQSIRQGILICNNQGRILYFNETYAAFIGRPLSDVIGTPIFHLRSGSKIPEVLNSGKALKYVLRHEDGQSYFADIYPIMEQGRVSGTISLVTTLEDARAMEQKDGRSLKERVQQFEQQQIRDLLTLYGNDLAGKQKVAEILDISLATLYNKLQK